MGDFAWVTLATNDTYSLGALVVAHSLRNVGTTHQLVVMVTPGVTAPMREKLASVFNVVFEVNILDSKDEANLMLLQRPELGVTFTKLHCWRLTQFKKCVFLDADTLVLQKCDELFEREELSAAPDVGWPDCFNSGVYVYTPSEATYESLVKFALEKGSFDGGDQGLLNLYFSDWAHKDISRHLPFIYNMCSTACYSYLPAFKQFGDQVKIIHFIGASKPWLQYFNTETMEVSSAPGFEHLKGIFEHWWNVFCKHVHSTLSPVMARTNTAIASCTSPSLLPLHCNEPIHQNTHCADVHSDIQTNHLPPWDPWEDYQHKTDSINNEEQTTVEFPTTHHHMYSSSQINVVHQYQSDTDAVVVVDNKDEIHSQCTKQNIESCHYVHHHSSNNSDTNSITPSETNISVHESYINEPVATTASVHHIHTNESPIITHPQCTTTDCHTPDPNMNSLTAVYKCKSASPVATDQSSFTDSHSGSTEAQIDKNGGLAGAFAQMTLGEPRSPTQSALEEHMRRQGWEIGRIDYLGQDSFDNIWKKICQTLSEVPQKQPSPPKELAPAVVSTTVEPAAAAPAEPTVTATAVPTPAAPAEPTPAAPAETIPAAPAEAIPAAPVETTPAAPAEATPAEATPAEPTVAAPPEPTPAVPAETTPAAPAEATPAAPAETTPAAPAQATPAEPTPAAPAEATPAAPAETTPAASAETTPAAPAESTVAASAEPTVGATAVPTPAAPTEATPAEPTVAAPAEPTVAATAVPTPAAPAEATPAAPAEATPAAPAEPTPVATAEPTPAAPAEPTPAAPAEPTPVAPVEATPTASAEAAPVTPAAPAEPITVTPIQITPATPTTPPAEPVPVLSKVQPTSTEVPEPAPLSQSSPKVPTETVVPGATVASAEGAVKAEAPSTPVQTEKPKDAKVKVKTVEKSPSATSAEQESAQSTPTPPPRKGSKNGGAASKKTPKKK